MALYNCYFEKVKGGQAFYGASISIHKIMPSLIGHETMGNQVLSVASLAIAREFINLFIVGKYGKLMMLKGAEVEKLAAYKKLICLIFK